MDKETKLFLILIIFAAILGIIFGLLIDIDWQSFLF